jgi:carboxymethylenebutenolidase
LLYELIDLLDIYHQDAQDLANRGYLIYVANCFNREWVKYCMCASGFKVGRSNTADSEGNQEIHTLLDVLKADPRSNDGLYLKYTVWFA